MTNKERNSIAWCEKCGNLSVDGINFARIENDKLECLACGSKGYWEWIRKPINSGPDLDSLGLVFRISTFNAVAHCTWSKAREWIKEAIEDGDDDFVWVSDDSKEAKVWPDL